MSILHALYVLYSSGIYHGFEAGEGRSLDMFVCYLIATAHSAGPGLGPCAADDMLPDDRNMLRPESLIPGVKHLGQ